jgi:hypothetical protein
MQSAIERHRKTLQQPGLQDHNLTKAGHENGGDHPSHAAGQSGHRGSIARRSLNTAATKTRNAAQPIASARRDCPFWRFTF